MQTDDNLKFDGGFDNSLRFGKVKVSISVPRYSAFGPWVNLVLGTKSSSCLAGLGVAGRGETTIDTPEDVYQAS